MAKESLIVHVGKLLFKKYMKNHKIIFFFNKLEEKKIKKEELIPLLSLKKIYWGLFYFYIVHD